MGFSVVSRPFLSKKSTRHANSSHSEKMEVSSILVSFDFPIDRFALLGQVIFSFVWIILGYEHFLFLLRDGWVRRTHPKVTMVACFLPAPQHLILKRTCSFAFAVLSFYVRLLKLLFFYLGLLQKRSNVSQNGRSHWSTCVGRKRIDKTRGVSEKQKWSLILDKKRFLCLEMSIQYIHLAGNPIMHLRRQT